MKTAIVTGAAGNLGRAVVKEFIAKGYKIFGTVMQGETVDFPLTHFVRMETDLLDEAACGDLVKTVIETSGHIDAAVLTVGGFAMGDVAATNAGDILKQYRLNFETAYNMARPIYMQMKKQNGGNIFFIGSRPGLDSKNGKGMIAYSLGKSLVFRLAELMNEEGRDHNIVCSVIVPGTIDTPQNRKAMPDADFSKWVKPEEIAGGISYYCSGEARSIREPLIKMY